MPSSHDLRGRRLGLALVFREWRTAREAARELGTQTGSIYGLIKRMRSEGLLRADSDPDEPTRGTQFLLTDAGRIALEEVLDQAPDEGSPGRVVDDQRLVIVQGDDLAGIQMVLAEPALSTAIAWGAWIGAGWLLAMRPQAGRHSFEKLTYALERAGYRCLRGRVDELVSGRGLRDAATGFVGEAAGR